MQVNITHRFNGRSRKWDISTDVTYTFVDYSTFRANQSDAIKLLTSYDKQDETKHF
ncbi:MAG: hypothetical protein WB511_08045 [Nitrososphaeraceae archaeon]